MKIKTSSKKNDPGNEVAAERVEHNLELIKKNFFLRVIKYFCD